MIIELSREHLVHAWDYAYFDQLRAGRTESRLYLWDAMSPSELWMTIGGLTLPSEHEDLDAQRATTASLVGSTAVMVRKLLRMSGVVAEIYPMFYFALGFYTQDEHPEWVKMSTHDLSTPLALAKGSIGPFVAHQYMLRHAVELLLWSLMYLARLRT